MPSYDSDSDVSFQEQKRRKRSKTKSDMQQRKRRNNEVKIPTQLLSFNPLLYPPGVTTIQDDDDTAFDETIGTLLPDFLQARLNLQEQNLKYDDEGTCLRPLTRSETSSIVNRGYPDPQDIFSVITMRKLKLSQQKRTANIRSKPITAEVKEVNMIETQPSKPEPKPEVLNALYNIKTTPFENSFLSRLQGTRGCQLPGLIAVDWETVTPWMNLMSDIRDHYSFSHPEKEQPIETIAPITYTSLEGWHLNQIHDLLQRVFWTGIDVSDSLDYSPERCTIVATYKKLVIGVAIMSSPQETYITFLAVKTGWDKAQIARTMLFHLIRMNPKRDITLHVSANNSAVLLYNQFGFKAEEFIAGFYEDYLDPASRASNNAFRLRLRQQ